MKISVKQMILVSLFAALTAVGAFIQIPLGTVPITLQFLFTSLAGVILGSKLGALSQIVYVIIGLMGLPIFAGGAGGFSVIISPTFGYLIGFILAAYAIGKIAEGSAKISFMRLFIGSLVGIIVIYIVGVPYLYAILNNVLGKKVTFAAALKIGFLVFLPGDLLKCVITAILGIRIIPAVKKFITS